MEYICRATNSYSFGIYANLTPCIMENSSVYQPIMAVKANQPKDYVNPLLSHEPKYKKDFIEFVLETVNRKKRRNKPSYEKVYQTLVMHLRKFCEINNVKLYVESVNEDFLDDFILYLEDQDYKVGYIEFLVSLIKAMVSKAGKYSYVVDPTYDDVKVDTDMPFSIALSMNQLTRIYYSEKITKCQEKIRDLFIVGALTALRYSDYSTLNSSNVKGEYIVKRTKKTDTEVTVPIHDFVREIYEKYGNAFPKATTAQNFNRQLKTLCKRIGLDDPIEYSCLRGSGRVTKTVPLYELISSHTARRTAATILYESGRFPLGYIMQLTGHKTEGCLRRYLKIEQEDIAKRMNGDVFWKK